MKQMNFCSLHKVWPIILLVGGIATGASVFAQDAPDSRTITTQQPTPTTTAEVPPPKPAPPNHAFWDRTNILLFSGVAVFRGLDYASTRNFQARGRTEILLARDVVNNSAAFAGVEAAGAATSVGISYIFHRTGHHRMERWLSIGHISVTAFGVGWNYSLKSKHPH